MDEDIEFDEQRVVRGFKVAGGGLFSSRKVEVEYEPIKYKFVNKTTILCNACQGAGKKPSPYGGTMECRFCDGRGTLKLKKPTKEV